MFLKRYIYCAVYAYNAVGTVIANTDEQGKVILDNDFDAYGIQLRSNDYSGSQVAGIGTSQNDLLFSTKERDFSIGLDNHGFRYYDSELGRYLTRDPIGYPNGANNYLYTNNNPINRVDPMGLSFGFGGVPGTKLHSQTNQSLRKMTVKEVQVALDIAGMDPTIGTAADATNTVISLVQGEFKDAGINAISMFPMADGIKLFKYTDEAADIVKASTKNADEIRDMKKAGDKATDSVPSTSNKPDTGTKVDTEVKCFPAGTLVLMADGSSKAIEKVEKGEVVFARNPDDNEEVGVYEVVNTLKNWTEHFIHVHIDKDADGITDVFLRATGKHPFWTKNRGWVYAADLKTSDVLEDVQGESLTVVKTEEEKIEGDTFNLTVAGVHTFYVVDDGVSVLVHNTGDDEAARRAAEKAKRRYLPGDKRPRTIVKSTRKKLKDARPKPNPAKKGKKRVTRQSKNKSGEGNKMKTDHGSQTEHFHDKNHGKKGKDNLHYRRTKQIKPCPK